MIGTYFLAVFAVLAVLDWIAVARHWIRVEYVAKPGAMLALLGYAMNGDRAGAGLLAALACSLLGDVLLMLPGDRFVAGLLAFFVAHVVYIATIPATTVSRLLWLAIVLAATIPISTRLVRAVADTRMRRAVAAYMLVLAAMTAAALASGNASAAVGALFFLASDALLGWNRFVGSVANARVAIMVTYHLGQLGLVTALR